MFANKLPSPLSLVIVFVWASTTLAAFIVPVNMDDPTVEILKECPGMPECLIESNRSETNALVWTNLTYTPTGFGRCCIPCECTSDCLTKGNCCVVRESNRIKWFDQNNNLTTVSERHINAKESCNQAIFSNKPFLPTSYPSFLMIRQCPEKFNRPTRELCSARNDSKLDTLTPVYSAIANKHYANKYCAECNGQASELLQWNIEVLCKQAEMVFSYLANGLPDSLRYGLDDDCAVLWKPPNQEKDLRCTTEIISSCKQSAVAALGESINDLCQQWNAPVIGAEFIFRNIYCRMCHLFDSIKIQSSCKLVQLTGKDGFTLVLGPDGFRRPKVESSVDMGDNCPRGHTFIPELNECLVVSCPLSSIRLGHRCMSFLSRVKGVTLHYSLSVMYDVSIHFQQDPNLVISEVKSKIGIHDGCYFSAEFERKSQHFYRYNVDLFVRHDEMISSVQSKYDEVVEKIRRNNILSQNKFYIKQDDSYKPSVSGKVNIVRKQYSFPEYVKICTDTVVSMVDIQFCNGVILSDFTIGTDDKLILQKAEFPLGQYVLLQENTPSKKTSVFVCLSRYASLILGRNVNIALPWEQQKTSDAFSVVSTFIVCLSVTFHAVVAILV